MCVCVFVLWSSSDLSFSVWSMISLLLTYLKYILEMTLLQMLIQSVWLRLYKLLLKCHLFANYSILCELERVAN